MRGLVGFALVSSLVACSPAPRDGRGDSDGDGDGPDASMTPVDGDFSGENAYVYAHTSGTLYKVDPETLAIMVVGGFHDGNGAIDGITDLAINKDNVMIALSFGAAYRVDPSNAALTFLSTLGTGDFNGLSFVPASMLGQSGDDVLVATRNDDGKVFQIDPMTGVGTQVGNMGASFQSSGDLVGIAGFGTVQTTLGAPWDVLTTLAPITFAGTPAAQSTGVGQIWGIGFWKGTVFGFTREGQFVTIDPSTGVATVIQSGGPEWWGAAVTTTAPIVP